ncbi:MAG: hypothetical protein QM642_00070 [Edaphocola sp.]
MKSHRINNLNFYSIFSMLVLLAGSCGKDNDEDVYPYGRYYFKIVKDGVDLSDSVLRNTSLFYYNSKGLIVSRPDKTDEAIAQGVEADNVTDDTTFFFLAYDHALKDGSNRQEYEYSHICFFNELANLPVTEGVSTFYFKYPDGDLDTLYIHSEQVSNKQAKKETCHCIIPIRELKFNGKNAVQDTSIHLSSGYPVYIFEK